MIQEKILIVDDEPEVLKALSLRLSRRFDIDVCSNPVEALEMILDKGEYPVIMSDLSMPGMNGIEFLQEVQKLSPATSTILLTGQGEYDTAVEALNSGVIFKYLVKPCRTEAVQDALSEALEVHNAKTAELLALDNHTKENNIAEILQKQLVFSHDCFGASVDFAVHAKARQKVSGDFFEVIPHKNECYDIILADVMGKGLSAALIGAATKNVIHQQLNLLMKDTYKSSLPSIGDVIGRVNKELFAKLQETQTFITLFYLRLNIKKNTVTFSNWGHPGALLLKDKKDGQVMQLQSGGLPLGVVKDISNKQESIHIAYGDKLVLFSDGITDALNEKEMTDTSKLIVSCLSGQEKNSDAVIKSILDKIKENSQDDMTLMSIILKSKEKERRKALLLRRDIDEVFRLNKYLMRSLTEENDLFKLAAIEAFTNILKYAGDSDLPIEVIAKEDANQVYKVWFVYDGPQFTPKAIKLPDCSQQVNGFGLYLLEKICENVDYSVLDDGRNSVCLTA